jgi:NAD(P)H-dependent flavin oxidoreductase YrpB (nitropropane dioxygenase family)
MINPLFVQKTSISLNKLKIGHYSVPYPIVQGGMGVGISGGSLAGNVARCGGIGVIAIAGIGAGKCQGDGTRYFQAEIEAINEALSKAYSIAPEGIIGVNIMTAATDFETTVGATIDAGAKILFCGAGLPLTLPELVKGHIDVALVPIVSSLRALQLITKKWVKSYNRLPDAVVVEDPETAGGHLGAKLDNIGKGEYDHYATIRSIKEYLRIEYGVVNIPVIAAGGIWNRNDILYALEQGADAVQMASRFVATVECDADDRFKQQYLDCKKEDIGLLMSPAGLPARGILKNLQKVIEYDKENQTVCPYSCMRSCTYRHGRERFCVISTLDRARQGDVETGLIFCGTNAWKADSISTVKDIFFELFG